ncbi:MAG TPA: hypothetical protein VJA25_11815 [Dehalococcoidia bacterium]|nr:hypothetical protein [Dehalococcoidia bacterium]
MKTVLTGFLVLQVAQEKRANRGLSVLLAYPARPAPMGQRVLPV